MSITITHDNNLYIGTLTQVVETPRVFWRVNHDTEMTRPNLPEVFPFLDNHYTNFTRGFQLLEKSLNPNMVNSKWRNLHLGGNAGQDATAFNNRQGFEMIDDPRVDYINGMDIGAPLPRQEALVCGGAILLERYHDGEYLYPDYIDGNLPAPSLQYVLDNSWLIFDAVTIRSGPSGVVEIGRFPQGNGERVYILLLASKPIRISLSKVTRVIEPFPSPYQYP